MARFGLLIQNNGIWNNDTLLKSSTYKNAMLNTSQTMNLSYGYLWWLNGKASHMLPGLQTVFPTSLCPNAPTDMIAAIGKNGQLISIAKSRGLVIIRMGEDANTNSANVSTILLDDIWQHINGLNCEPTNITPVQNEVQLIQNPVVNTLKFSLSSKQNYSTSIFNMQGNKIYYSSNINFIDISSYSKGMYLLQVRQGSNSFTNKFLKE
jgi:CubicO group peptidase (beta-lactamase class C family)